MTNVIRAELTKLSRRRLLVGTLVAAGVFATVATVAVFLAAQPAGPAPGRTITLAELSRAGGGTLAFATGASFAGLLVFATFIANFTGEFSQGTFRTLLMRQPGRIRLLTGKMVALLLFAAAFLLAAEALTLVASSIIAPTRGVPLAEWFTLSGLGEAAGHFATSLVVVSGWALLGMGLAVVVRSTPVALAIGVAWAGPFEHILQDTWSAASRWFPGLLLEALAVGGTPDASYQRAALMVAGYVVVASGTALALFARRDVTS
jgi:hypothetical protein